MNSLHHKRTSSSSAGFTMIELLVSLSIMVIIVTLILVNYRKFDGTVVLTNLAYDMSLSVRKAQTYGISVKGQKTGSDQTFSYPYGITFSSASTTTYTLFADTNVNGNGTFGNGLYDGGEGVETYTLRGSYRITNLCTVDANNNETCGLSNIDITFLRPNPDAKIITNRTTQTTNAAKIKIGTSQDSSVTRTILIRTTGQISVQ